MSLKNIFKVRYILISLLFYYKIKKDESPPQNYFLQNKEYKLEDFLRQLFNYYNTIDTYNKQVYIDILLFLKGQLNNDNERFALKIIKEEFLKDEIKEFFSSYGGSFKRQIIKKVIRKY